MQDVVAELGGKGVARSWIVCGLYVDFLGILETESVLPNRELDTSYGTVMIIPPELALVERILIACYPPSQELLYDCTEDDGGGIERCQFRLE